MSSEAVLPVQTTPLFKSLKNKEPCDVFRRERNAKRGTFHCQSLAIPACTHFVGFRDDRYWNAVAVFGRPHFIHRWWDKRARREIAASDTVVFADGEWTQEPKRFNAPDLTEEAA